MQFTEGTYEEAKKYCVRDGGVKKQGPWHDLSSCWLNWSYMRLSPSDSIEMTSAYLHAKVNDLVNKFNLDVSIKVKQKMAAGIHLCGVNRVERHLKNKNLDIGLCGSHRFGDYVKKLSYFKKVFASFER